MEYRTLDVDGYMNDSSLFRPQQEETKETTLKSSPDDDKQGKKPFTE